MFEIVYLEISKSVLGIKVRFSKPNDPYLSFFLSSGP